MDYTPFIAIFVLTCYYSYRQVVDPWLITARYMNITYRQATPADKDLIITTIVASEKGDYDIISYCAIFSITEDEFRELVSNILDEEMEGQEICYSNFIIAEVDGKTAATLGAFVEKRDGLSSNMIKMNMLMFFLDRQKVLDAAPMISLMNETSLPREEFALQYEYGYILPEYRGHGLLRHLMDEHIRVNKERGLKNRKMQLIILENNIGARKSHEKYGFVLTGRQQSQNPDIFKIMACDTKILMEKFID